MNALILDCTLGELSILNDIDENEYYSEGAVYDVLNDLVSFIQKMINNIVAFAKKLKNDVSSLIKKKEVHFKLRQLKKDLQEQKANGSKKVQMVDVPSYVRYYDSCYMKIKKKLNTLSRGNFKSKRKLEAVASSIEDDLNDMEEELQYILHNKIQVPIDVAIKYVEDNLKGTNTMEKDFIEITHELKNVGITMEKNLKNISLTDDEKIAKEHVSLIKRVIRKISSVFGKFWQKIVMAVVFFFA